MFFNKNLKFLIKNNGINQNKLANLMGITRQTVNKIMKTQNPTISTVIKICDIFQISIDDLINKDLESEYLEKS